MEVSTHAHIDSSTTVPVPTSVARDARGTERQNGIRRLGIALLAALALFAFQLVSAHSASADTGIPCPQAGTETVATDSPAYQGGETAHITGSGYSIGCDVTVQVTRPGGVVETGTASTNLEGNFSGASNVSVGERGRLV
jgi:hypothetical protein